MKLKEFINFYINKNDHYEISDDFVKSGYQQKNGGYIARAKHRNVTIDYKEAEPNQKWHLLCSYIPYVYFNDVEMTYEEVDNKCTNDIEFNTKSYNFLQCPELILWMAEAADIDKKLIKQASDYSKKIIDEDGKMGRSKAGRVMWSNEPFKFKEKVIDAIWNKGL